MPDISAAAVKSLRDKTGLPMMEKGPFAATTLISLMRDHPSWCASPGAPEPVCRSTLGGPSTTDSPCSSSATGPI